MEVAPHVNYALDPGAAPPRARIQPPRAPCVVLYKMDEYESVSDRRRRLSRQRVQRHRGRTDEARRETGRQNEVNVRRSQRLAITRGYQCSGTAKLYHRRLLSETDSYTRYSYTCTKWMSTSQFLTGDDDCQGKECSDIEGELMRRGGRLAGRMKLTFAVHRDSLSLVVISVLELPNCIIVVSCQKLTRTPGARVSNALQKKRLLT